MSRTAEPKVAVAALPEFLTSPSRTSIAAGLEVLAGQIVANSNEDDLMHRIVEAQAQIYRDAAAEIRAFKLPADTRAEMRNGTS